MVSTVRLFIRSLYFSNRFFFGLLGLSIFFVVGQFLPFFYALAKIVSLFFFVLFIADLLLLYHQKEAIQASRNMPERLSNGDRNQITLEITNLYPFEAYVQLIDEIPYVFQIRDFAINKKLAPAETHTLSYFLRPTERGEYTFGHLRVFVQSLLGLLERRFTFFENKSIPVYPSYVQMRKYELMAISNRLMEVGIKKIRKKSNNNEFDQIREYVSGDDNRLINWKATARRSQLMVNQYQDEKSQQVYSIIDMGRNMQMPFEGMSLLDYAINASLVISNIAVFKQDKAGIISFSEQIHNLLPASYKKGQMMHIMDLLYRQETKFTESNFEKLYITVRQKIQQRSLLFIYTNFEGLVSLKKQLPYLKMLNKNHLLVVVFFENTEIKKRLVTRPRNAEQTYIKTVAEKFVYEKRLIVRELNKFGIHAILTKPENLTVASINKYLELKSTGLI